MLHTKQNGYTSGAYGDARVRSFYKSLDWKNEWELIPEDQKKQLLDWLNQINFDDLLYKQSLVAQKDNPILQHLTKEEVLPETTIDMLDYASFTVDNKEIPVTEHREAKSFMEAFIYHKNSSSKMSMIYQPQRIRVGFVVNDHEEVHFIHFATLHPIWRPKSQTDLMESHKKELESNSSKSDQNLDKMFKTTGKHHLGEHWAGVLCLNMPKMSTVVGGYQNALKIPVPRYAIEWVNLKNPRNRITTMYSGSEFEELLSENHILETDGSEKAPRMYPEDHYVGYGTLPK